MEHQKILNSRKWTIFSDHSKSNNDAENEITYNTKVFKSNLCDYIDAYILMRGDITIIGRQAT